MAETISRTSAAKRRNFLLQLRSRSTGNPIIKLHSLVALRGRAAVITTFGGLARIATTG